MKHTRGDILLGWTQMTFLADRFAREASFLDQNPEVALVGSAFYIINESGDLISRVDLEDKDAQIREALKTQNRFAHAA